MGDEGIDFARATVRRSSRLRDVMDEFWRRWPRSPRIGVTLGVMSRPLSPPRRREMDERRPRNGMSLSDENDVLREMSALSRSNGIPPSVIMVVVGRTRETGREGSTAPRISDDANTSREVRESAKLSRLRNLGVSRIEVRRES